MESKILNRVQWLDHSTWKAISGFQRKDFNHSSNLPWDVQQLLLLLVVKLLISASVESQCSATGYRFPLKSAE